MERLTSRDEKGNLNVDGKRSICRISVQCSSTTEEYEDTGLTPEQIMELKEAVQKLENIFGDEITINQVIDFSLISILHRVIQTEWKKQNC